MSRLAASVSAKNSFVRAQQALFGKALGDTSRGAI
jgi:hypothetical protein